MKSPPVTRPKVLLKRPPVTLTKVPPPVEKYAVPKGPVVPHFNISDFPMVLPALASSIPSSPATTLAPDTPLVLPSTVPSKPKPKAPPAIAAPKPRAPSREQVQLEVDAIMRDVEEKRTKRSKQQQQLHDDMLSAIFKSVFEDTVPDSAVGIYSSGEKDRMGCAIPKVIDFRSLPVPVQDNLMRAEILPTMWPRYRISGYNLPEPVATWYGSFYTDYMTYLDIADLDSVLAAQVASPGSQVTIQFIALALEKAEANAQASDQTLNEYLENRTIRTIADLGPVHSGGELCLADRQ